MSTNEKGRRPLFLLTTVAVASLLVGFAATKYLLPAAPDALSIEECAKKYSFLRNDLDCNAVEDDYARVNQIQDDLNTYINKKRSDGKVTRVSVFFRDLSSRRWAAVGKDERYAPGSMLKVVLAIAYLKLSEIEPQILTQEVIYSPSKVSMNDMEKFKPKSNLVPGEKYSVESLIERMIKDSDNDVTLLLNDSIDQGFLHKVFSDLNITLPASGGSEQNFVGVERISSMMRALYLASYLNADNSQKLLSLMTQTSFAQGIASGVPTHTPVAHKFGEREVVDMDTKKAVSAELHDCGIVYKDDHPYILCVMTEGSTYDHLTNILSDISKLVYESE
jgi:beta-lactamase class A